MQTDQAQLRIILTRIDHPSVKLLDEKVRKISARDALLAAHGGDYEYGGTKSRVRWMRPVRETHPFRMCWRTCEAAVLPPPAEYFLAMR